MSPNCVYLSLRYKKHQPRGVSKTGTLWVLRCKDTYFFIIANGFTDWLVNQAHTGKMLGERAKDIQAKAAELKKSGTYSPDRMVSSFMMGFWTFPGL